MDHDEHQRSRRVLALIVVVLGIAAVAYGVLTPDDYRSGTPAKATVDHCRFQDLGMPSQGSSPDLYCTGTWSLDGQTHTGPIKPPIPSKDQSGIREGKTVLDVHVHNGSAYTADAAGKYFYVSLIIAAGLLLWGTYWLWKIWARRRK